MATLSTPVATTPSRLDEGSFDVAAQAMYDAEVALHIARQAGVDAWVAAAYDRLHEAIVIYLAAHADRSIAGR